MQQRAVIIGVEDYAAAEFHALPATTHDATAIAALLNDDSESGLSVRLCTRNSIGTSKALIEAEIESALASDASLVVIYFSGHGTLSRGGDYGQLVVSDGRIDMYWLMARIHAHNGRYRSTVVILDCCHAGAMGAPQLDDLPEVEIERGVTILAASDSTQVALESAEHGVFSQLLIQGLEGACADADGRVTPALLYTYIDQAMGTKDQRPVFATNIQRSPVLKQVMTSPEHADRVTARASGPINRATLGSGLTDAPAIKPAAINAERKQTVRKPSGVLAGFAAGVLLMLTAAGLWSVWSQHESTETDGDRAPTGELPLAEQLLRINALAEAPQLPTFVLIPAGQFTQGSDGYSLRGDETPTKRVAIDDFFMSTTEITLGQFIQLQADDVPVLSEPHQTPTHPVVHVSWQEAQAYASRLGQQYRDQGQQVQCTLPTESEWEYAARGGTATDWYWGDDQNKAGQYAWTFSNSSIEQTLQSHAVGQKLPNGFGLYDTSGNVWEWVDDCYARYDTAVLVPSWQQSDTTDAKACQRVRRGGAFDTHVISVKPSSRGASSADTKTNAIGFRVACRPNTDP